MRLSELVAGVHGGFDAHAAMADVAALSEHDRYQAGAGIDAAAEYVAERAADAGLADVEVLRFPADGGRHWWTFAGPVWWTPRRASVRIDGAPVLRYPEQPYALAANSAATPLRRLPVRRWSAVERPDPAGALVLLHDVALPTLLGELVDRGAAGVVADPLAARRERRPGEVGRIELPVRCPVFAFSATPERLAALDRAAAAGIPVEVLVEAESRAGTLPVVTARLPGRAPPGTWASHDASLGTRDAHIASDDGGELLLSAHLCHPRPSANDNASGVAALLGLARAHREFGRQGRAVRFVWGPEFVGMAAYLHDVVHAGRAPRPVAAVNVDMAGQDQRRCGGPLVIERAPDELPSPVSAVAERCAALLPPAARSYSGAVPCDTWAWRATPYVGASDHAMLTGPPTRCPAISLGHWPDAANHTSADTLDLVDPEELRRTATIAGATIAALRRAGGDGELAADVADATVAWAANHVLSALPGARPPAPASPPPGPVLDPWAPEHAARLLRHRATVAQQTLHALNLEADVVNVASVLPSWTDATSTEAASAEEVAAEVLAPVWEGPFNLRYLGECAAADDRAWLAEVSARDRGGSYARLLALARGLDGRRDGTAVAWWAALTSELAVPVPMARRFLRLLGDVGWARSSTGGA